ncbi:phage BR0599 family protein [Opitutus sp. ER46]|uniref:phage BR0599 family protein n=1 Tax=Opitutus sp. ER46 TaxID=2161864 RepID=UPI000D31C6E4|nr:phage BR0599 family protein [Opitutus sp. ER46]PTX95775.1 hypothetical protein DB354_10210 [Opitutus sp. ER46]
MYPVTIYGASAWAFPYGPNNDETVSLKPSIDLETVRGQTGRGSRRPQAWLLRHELSWTSDLGASEFFAARAASIDAQDEPFVVPFWPAARPVARAPLMTTGLTVAWTRDWSSYALNPASLTGYDFFAPAIMGVFKQPPRLVGRSSNWVRGEFTLVEQGPAEAALTPPIVTDVTLATPDGYLAPVFPFSPDGGADPKLGFAQVESERRALGPGRIPSRVFYPQKPETPLQPSFKFRSVEEIVAFLGWYHRRAGGAGSFWIASTQAVGELTADLAVGATAIPTAQPMAIKVGDTLALCTTGRAPELVRVQSIVAGVPQLAAPISIAHPRAWTIVAPAILARHTDSEPTIKLAQSGDGWIGGTTLAFREVASEYAATDGEVRGVTLGRLAPWAWLAEIELDYAGALQTWYVTNFESGVTTPGGQVWEYHDFSFSDTTESVDLEDDSCTLKIRWWDGCPWENWLPGKLAATGRLRIKRAAVAADGSVGAPESFWSGILSTPQREGPMLSVKVAGANSMFSRRTPRALMEPVCWKQHYGVECGLVLSEWEHNATVTAVAGLQVTVNALARKDGGATHPGFAFQDWFALGWAQRVDASGRPVRAEVIASTGLAGGSITLTLGRSLGCAVGDVIVLAPGCDRSHDTCYVYDATNNPRGKFNNLNSFGGSHEMPAVSPNFKVPNTSPNSAKK